MSFLREAIASANSCLAAADALFSHAMMKVASQRERMRSIPFAASQPTKDETTSRTDFVMLQFKAKITIEANDFFLRHSKSDLRATDFARRFGVVKDGEGVSVSDVIMRADQVFA